MWQYGNQVSSSSDEISIRMGDGESISKGHAFEIRVLLTILYVVIYIIGFTGNVCSCLVIADSRNRYMKTATNFYLFSLSLSDLLLLTFGMSHDLMDIWHPSPYPFNSFACISRCWVSEAGATASVMVITAFSVERYLAICHPLSAQKFSRLSRAIKTIIFIWLVASLWALVVALQFGVQTFIVETLITVPLDGLPFEMAPKDKNNSSVLEEYIPMGLLVNTSDTVANKTRAAVRQVLRREAIPLCTTVALNEKIFEISVLIFFVVPMSVITILYVKIGYQLRKKTLFNRVSLGGGGGVDGERLQTKCDMRMDSSEAKSSPIAGSFAWRSFISRSFIVPNIIESNTAMVLTDFKRDFCGRQKLSGDKFNEHELVSEITISMNGSPVSRHTTSTTSNGFSHRITQTRHPVQIEVIDQKALEMGSTKFDWNQPFSALCCPRWHLRDGSRVIKIGKNQSAIHQDGLNQLSDQCAGSRRVQSEGLCDGLAHTEPLVKNNSRTSPVLNAQRKQERKSRRQSGTSEKSADIALPNRPVGGVAPNDNRVRDCERVSLGGLIDGPDGWANNNGAPQVVPEPQQMDTLRDSARETTASSTNRWCAPKSIGQQQSATTLSDRHRASNGSAIPMTNRVNSSPTQSHERIDGSAENFHDKVTAPNCATKFSAALALEHHSPRDLVIGAGGSVIDTNETSERAHQARGHCNIEAFSLRARTLSRCEQARAAALQALESRNLREAINASSCGDIVTCNFYEMAHKLSTSPDKRCANLVLDEAAWLRREPLATNAAKVVPRNGNDDLWSASKLPESVQIDGQHLKATTTSGGVVNDRPPQAANMRQEQQLKQTVVWAATNGSGQTTARLVRQHDFLAKVDKSLPPATLDDDPLPARLFANNLRQSPKQERKHKTHRKCSLQETSNKRFVHKADPATIGTPQECNRKLRTNSEDQNSVRRHSVNFALNSRLNASNMQSVTKMLVSIVVMFFICWAPFHAQRLMAIYVKEPTSKQRFIFNLLNHISGLTYFISAVANPILYSLYSMRFRQAFRDTFGQISGTRSLAAMLRRMG